jgi:NAD-dependent SIR2 family protein deacetylase
MSDDSVQIHCKRCRATFRDRARRVQPGYSRQCPGCEVVIFFEESSNDKNVHTALQAARNVRRALREAEGVKKVAKPATIYDRSS